MSVSDKPVVVVTGANRGLGLEFVTQILKADHGLPNVPKDAIVVATCRDPSKADDLKKLQQEYQGRVDIVANDVTDEKSNESLVDHVKTKYGRVDMIIFNAGMGRVDTIGDFKRDLAIETILVNAIAPTEQTRMFLPLIKATEQMKTEKGTKVDKSNPAVKLIYVSSSIGSIANTTSGTAPSYRTSKATLNMFVRAIALSTPEVSVLCLHPGWVDTDMGRNYGKPPLDAKTSISNSLKRINEMTLDNSAKGLITHDGNTLPW